VDFTSALYLGFAHESASLRWNQLTTGVPAGLRRAAEAAEPEIGFAALVGCERAVALPSTLHAFWDLFGATCQPDVSILFDSAVYPVARFGIERAVTRGIPAEKFAHHDPVDLARRLGRLPARARPWIVTDGFCPGCLQLPPLAEYRRLIAARDGRLLVDDTQAVGLFGSAPSKSLPFGHGGGGSLRRLAAVWPGVILIASMAKALGVPVTMVAASAPFIESFTEQSDTWVHCSPPSIAHLKAAALALARNQVEGDQLRCRLLENVRAFRREMRDAGLPVRGGIFPLQRLIMPSLAAAARVERGLADRGVQTVVERPRCRDEAAVTFIITAGHDDAQARLAATVTRGVMRDFAQISHLMNPPMEASR